MKKTFFSACSLCAVVFLLNSSFTGINPGGPIYQIEVRIDWVDSASGTGFYRTPPNLTIDRIIVPNFVFYTITDTGVDFFVYRELWNYPGGRPSKKECTVIFTNRTSHKFDMIFE